MQEGTQLTKITARRRGRTKSGFPARLHRCRRVLRQNAEQAAQGTRHRRRAAWVPVELPGLVGGANEWGLWYCQVEADGRF